MQLSHFYRNFRADSAGTLRLASGVRRFAKPEDPVGDAQN
jgi:hypothetical protein